MRIGAPPFHSCRRECKLLHSHSKIKEISMHALLAFVNGAGSKRRAAATKTDPEGLRLLNLLRSNAASESPARVGGKGGKSKDVRQAEEKSNKAKHGSKPGGFHNDPNDPTNPNEVRERHLEKIKR
jgi:hypothetical protein